MSDKPTDAMPARLCVAVAALIIAAVTVAGCAAHPGPIIDTKGVDLAAYERDLAECSAYADNINTGTGAAKGAAAGAVVGGAIGAIGGDAARGAGYGAVGGGAESALQANRDRQAVVKRCLSGRGYRVLN